MRRKDIMRLGLIVVGFMIMVFFAGYTMGEEKTEERLIKQQKVMGIVHLDRQPYRCEPTF